MKIRRSQDRGHAQHGWLDSHHTFSFADYFDPKHMGFSVLRVINEDLIAGGTGFGMHPHSNMEIISYMVSGALEHRDSMGNTAVIRPGEVQRMSAGTGVRHSEYNHSPTETAHLIQIWILPEKLGIQPSYEQKSFANQLERGGMVLAASKNGETGSVSLNQDIKLWVLKSAAAGEQNLAMNPERKYWLQVVRGKADVGGQSLNPGDAGIFENEGAQTLSWKGEIEALFFDLPQ